MLNKTNYNAYKGRSIDFTKEVKIYKNLHNGLWSIMQSGLVVAHVESFSLYGVTFKVSESGRQKVIRERKKYVHAFIVGRLLEVNCIGRENALTSILVRNNKLTYNPFKGGHFVHLKGGELYNAFENGALYDIGLVGHCDHGVCIL